MKALNNAKISKRSAKTFVHDLTAACEAAEQSHSRCKQRLAIIIDDAERYLEEASAVNSDSSGRVNMSVQEAAAVGFVDDMVSTYTGARILGLG